MKSRKSSCTTPGFGLGVGIGVGICVGGGFDVSKMLKFYVKVFYVIGKALSGELSCPYDRCCFIWDLIEAKISWEELIKYLFSSVEYM